MQLLTFLIYHHYVIKLTPVWICSLQQNTGIELQQLLQFHFCLTIFDNVHKNATLSQLNVDGLTDQKLLLLKCPLQSLTIFFFLPVTGKKKVNPMTAILMLCSHMNTSIV